MPRVEVRFAGFGGQGVVLAGVLLGKAAVISEGKHAIQTQSYGAAARGGAARSDVIISGDIIVYPNITAPHVLAAFTTEAYDKNKAELKPDAAVIIDEGFVTVPDDVPYKVYAVPATATAVNEFGRAIVANMIMLGYCAALTGVVGTDALEETIGTSVPSGTEELNISAFRKGVALYQKREKTEK